MTDIIGYTEKGRKYRIEPGKVYCSKIDEYVSKFSEYISKIENSNIILLRQPSVIQWLFGDLSFLPEIEKKK